MPRAPWTLIFLISAFRVAGITGVATTPSQVTLEVKVGTRTNLDGQGSMLHSLSLGLGFTFSG
jgi:hypothetical protein